MPTPPTTPGRIPVRINPRLVALAAVYFFTYMGMGIYTPYLNLHFVQIGLSGSAIGLIAAVVPLGAMFGPPLIASFVDSRGHAGAAVAALFVTSGAMFSLIIFAATPWLIVPIMFVFGLLHRSIPPLLDATAMEYLSKTQGSYGRLRMWGSAGFMVAAVIVGFLATGFGIRPVLGAFVITAVIAALLARRLPAQARKPDQAQGLLAGLKGLSSASLGTNFHRFAGVLVLGHLADITQHMFFAIHLDRLGIPAYFVGMAWTVAVTSEMIVLWNIDKLMNRFGPRWAVIAGLAAGALRWGLTAITVHPLAIISVQALHGLTFGALYAGMVRFIAMEVPETSRASGQAVITGARAALAGMVGSFLVGTLSDVWSLTTLYAASAGVSVVAAVLMATVVSDPLGDANKARQEPA